MSYQLIDNRCSHPGCRGKNAYRMIGRCGNCGLDQLVVLITAGHDAPYEAACSKCGCYRVRCLRLATDDEIPEKQ